MQQQLLLVLRRFSVNLSLPLYLWDIVKNSSKAERIACMAAVVVVISCITLIVYYTLRTARAAANSIDRPPHEWNISRQMWLAQPYNYTYTTEQFEPLMLVVIQHTVSPECARFVQCAAELRNIQGYFIKQLKYDIPYNFIIGNDGRVYEARGWSIEGAHTRGYNRCSLGVGFIGDYREEMPHYTRVTAAQLNRTRMLLEQGVQLGHLRSDYQVVGARDVTDTASPGSNLYNAIRNWPNYDHRNRFKGLTCEQMYEMYTDVNLQH